MGRFERLICGAAWLWGCGGAAVQAPREEPPTTESRTPAGGGASDTPAPAVNAVAFTGEWVVNGAPFTPAAALVVPREGRFEVLVTAPAVDCDYAANGGVPPDGLRTVRISTEWTAPGTHRSESSDANHQVVFGYDAPSEMFEGRVVATNLIASGQYTLDSPPPAPGQPARLSLEVEFSTDAARDHVRGTIEARLCP